MSRVGEYRCSRTDLFSTPGLGSAPCLGGQVALADVVQLHLANGRDLWDSGNGVCFICIVFRQRLGIAKHSFTLPQPRQPDLLSFTGCEEVAASRSCSCLGGLPSCFSSVCCHPHLIKLPSH